MESEENVAARWLRCRSILRRAATLEPSNWAVTFCSALLLGVTSSAHTLLVSAAYGGLGLAFDDAWIHVQYARTIFEGRPWEYARGIPSTGSSAPLWSVVLMPLFLFGSEPDQITSSVLTLSAALYVLDIFLVGRLIAHHCESSTVSIAGQTVFVLVPRNAGMMLSGMETPLAMLILLLAMLWVRKPEKRYDMLTGVVVGLAYLTRPEFAVLGLLLIPGRTLWLLHKNQLEKRRILSLCMMFVLAAVVVLPWVAHCMSATGQLLADTYYAKTRFGIAPGDYLLWDSWWQYWVSSDVFLGAGFLGGVLILLRRKLVEPSITFVLFLLYRATMPHNALLGDARYLVPLFDLLSICFVVGTSLAAGMLVKAAVVAPRAKPNDRTVLTLALVLLVLLPSVASYQHHSNVHANQVKNVREMQLSLSLWAEENVQADEVIASYDVGAIGYLTKGLLIDVYGLVTPEILYNRTTTDRVAAYLKELGCDYLMIYVEWSDALRFSMSKIGAEFSLEIFVQIEDNVVNGTPRMAIWSVRWE